MNSLSHYLDRLRRDGLTAIVKRKLDHRWNQLRINNHTVGRLVELAGNKVRIEGLKFSVDCPGITTSHKSTLCFGLHEIEERALLNRWLPADLPVVEIGGGLGVVSCLSNRKMSRPQDHVVVEANPLLVPLLEQNRDLNRCQFKVVNAALAYDTQMIELGIDSAFVGSSIEGSFDRTVSVPTTSVAAIADSNGFDRFSLISDCEGGEGALVDRELDTLRNRCRFLLVEIHPARLGQEGFDRMIKRLLDAHFVLKEQLVQNWVFEHQ
jgi:FkbM family methyltransferase